MRRLAPPLLAFAGLQLLIALVAHWCGFDAFSTSTWSRWDSGLYLSIAQGGYHLEHCGPLSGHPASAYCGNAGWFPGYPWLIRILVAAGLRIDIAAMAIPLVCHLLALVAFWRMFSASPFALALACVFPGTIYLHALFPIAPLVLCTLLVLSSFSTGHYRFAAVFACAAATLYPTGFVPAFAIALLAAVRRDRALLRGAAWVLVGSLIGVALVLVSQHAAIGVWDGYFKAHVVYGQGIHNPLDSLLARWKPLVNPRYRDEKGVWTALQSVAVFLLLASIARRSKAIWRQGTLWQLMLIYGFTTWLIPLIAGGNTSFYRPDALLLPLAALVPGTPKAAFAAFIVVFLILFIAMERLFLLSILV